MQTPTREWATPQVIDLDQTSEDVHGGGGAAGDNFFVTPTS